jgi:hypothetical protein
MSVVPGEPGAQQPAPIGAGFARLPQRLLERIDIERAYHERVEPNMVSGNLDIRRGASLLQRWFQHPPQAMHRFAQRSIRPVGRSIRPEEIEHLVAWETVRWMREQEQQQRAGTATRPRIGRQRARTDGEPDRSQQSCM